MILPVIYDFSPVRKMDQLGFFFFKHAKTIWRSDHRAGKFF